MNEDAPIRIICVHAASVPALAMFNANEWSNPATQGVIQACATELAGLQYTADQIVASCASARVACLPHFETLTASWGNGPRDMSRLLFFGQVPAVHVLARAFLSGVKSLLDLSAELLSTEGVVGIPIDGFHREKGVYGGVVINALDRNVKKGRGPIAEAIKTLFLQHKARWADDLIQFRDLLVHPLRGAQELMFELKLESRDGALQYVDATPPSVGGQSIGAYVVQRLTDARELCTGVLVELRGGRPTRG